MKRIKGTTVRRIWIAGALALIVLLVAALALSRGRKPTLSDRQSRLDYLAELGWQVDPDSEQRQEILLPEQFGEVMQQYNELQTQQGFDLAPYAGKSVTLYSYEIVNWPDENVTVIADLYCCKGRAVAGDVHSTALDGFMLGLK